MTSFGQGFVREVARQRGRSHLVASVLLACFSLFIPGALFSQEAPTTQDIADALLGKTSPTTSELEAMDVNADGVVDTADIVFLGGTPLELQFASATSIVTEGTTAHLVEIIATRSVSGLRVSYEVGGSASADDYLDIFAGEVEMNGRSVTLQLSAAADELFEEFETVELELTPSVDFFLGDQPSPCRDAGRKSGFHPR